MNVTRSRVLEKLPRSCVSLTQAGEAAAKAWVKAKSAELEASGVEPSEAALQADAAGKERELEPAVVAKLDLSGLGATSLEAGLLVGFRALVRLELQGNDLRDLPRGLAAACPLTYLDVSKNPGLSCEGVARALEGATKLVTLKAAQIDASSADAASLDKALGLSSVASSLKVLLVEDSKLQGKLALGSLLGGIEVLVVSHNQLSSIDVRGAANLVKLSASHNTTLSAFPDVRGCASLAEVRVSHCTGMSSVELLRKAAADVAGHLKLLDVADVPGVSSWDLLEPYATLEILNLSGTPLVGELSPTEVAPLAVERFPNLRVLNSKPVTGAGGAKASSKTTRSFAEAYRIKEEKRRRNLISTKLHAPDPTKPRNKPCPCGSGLKFKACCEKESSGSAPALKPVNEPDGDVRRVLGTAGKRKPHIPGEVSGKRRDGGQGEDEAGMPTRERGLVPKYGKSATLPTTTLHGSPAADVPKPKLPTSSTTKSPTSSTAHGHVVEVKKPRLTQATELDPDIQELKAADDDLFGGKSLRW